MLYRFAPVLVSLAVVSLAAPSLAAAPDYETRYGAVATEGLDLTTEAGRAALHERVKREASALCGTIGNGDYLLEAVAIRRCRAGAVRDAEAQIVAAEGRAVAARAAAPSRVSSAN